MSHIVTLSNPSTSMIVWINFLNVAASTPIIGAEITSSDPSTMNAVFELRGNNKITFTNNGGSSLTAKIVFDILNGDTNVSLAIGANQPGTMINIDNDAPIEIPVTPGGINLVHL